MWIMLQILTYMIVMVIAAKAKIKGTFQCTPPRHTPNTCLTTNLPTVTDRSFDCTPNNDVSMGEACALSCNDGFYAAYSNQVVCETGTRDQEGKWSEGSFECRAIKCSTTNLPTVTDGSFDCAPNTDVSMGEACTLTCDGGFYAAYSSQVVCEAGTSHQEGKWSKGSFVCRAITCQEVHLPTVNAGFFNCSGFSVGDKCNLTCDDDYYSSATKYTVCEEDDDHKANWTAGKFQCSAIECSTTNLPTVSEGSFNCTPNSNVSMGEVCNVTCNTGLYPTSSRQAVCEAGISNQGGMWSNGSFVCRRLKCNDWNEWDGSEYKSISTEQTWEESRQMCESDNSHLVTIENKEENEFVHKMMVQCDLYKAWIGLNDRITEGSWEWGDGTVSTYRNWGEGEPNGGDTHDCGHHYAVNGEWYDDSCTDKKYAVCERNNSLT